jgi:Domain of unknown function (DUF4388)
MPLTPSGGSGQRGPHFPEHDALRPDTPQAKAKAKAKRQPSPSASGTGFRGDASVLGLDEVILFLASNGVEGQLTISNDTSSLELYIQDGDVLCPNTALRKTTTGKTGSTATVGGKLTRGSLQEILGRAQKVAQETEAPPATPAPKPARSTGKLRRDAMADLLARAERLGVRERPRRLVEVLNSLLKGDRTRFEFEPSPVPAEAEQRARSKGIVIDHQSLIMDLARIMDEERLAQKERRRQRKLAGADDTRIVSRVGMRAARPDEGRKVVRGSLDGIGLAPILQALCTGRRSGVLAVEADQREEQIYFESGRAYVLRSDGPAESEFVEMLLGADGSDSLSCLGSLGDLERAQEEEAKAIQEKFLDMLFWEGAQFCFQRGDLPDEFLKPTPGTLRIELNTNLLLMNTMARLAEWEELRKSLGGTRTFQFLTHALKLEAIKGGAEGTSEVLTLVDGQKDFDDLVRISGRTHLEIGRALVPLVERGALRPATDE